MSADGGLSLEKHVQRISRLLSVTVTKSQLEYRAVNYLKLFFFSICIFLL